MRYLNIHNVGPAWGDPVWRRAGDWLLREDMGGGRLGASGSHMIDLLRFWLGDIGALSGLVATMAPERFDRDTGARWRATADDHFSFTAEMRNGALCTVTVSFSGRHGNGSHTQISGAEGTITLSESDEKLLLAPAGAKTFKI